MPPDAEQEKEQDGPEKLDRKEKKIIKKKSPFLPGKPRALDFGSLRMARCSLWRNMPCFYSEGGVCSTFRWRLPRSIYLIFKMENHGTICLTSSFAWRPSSP